MKFRYKSSINPDDSDPTPIAPRIPIVLRGKETSLQNLGIPDSGSTDITVGKDIAEILGLPIGKEITIKTAGGEITGHYSKISLEIPIKHNPVRMKDLSCIVIPNLDEIILGRTGFFEPFEITFCESEKWINLKDIRGRNLSKRR